MKRLALTPDEIDLVFEHRKRKEAFNEGLAAAERAIKLKLSPNEMTQCVLDILSELRQK